MTRATLLAVLVAIACSPARPLDTGLEPALAARGNVQPLGDVLPRFELLADGELLVEGQSYAGDVERRAWIAERLANVPRVHLDDDTPEFLVLSPIELWVDARTPFEHVEELLDDLMDHPIVARDIFIGTRAATGDLGVLPAHVPVLGASDCFRDRMDLHVREVGPPGDPAIRLWWREMVDTSPRREVQRFASVAELGRHVGESMAEWCYLEADPGVPWQRVIEASELLAAHGMETWFLRADRR